MAGIAMTIAQVIVGVLVAIAAVLMITCTFPKDGTSAAQKEPVFVEIQTKLGTFKGVELEIPSSRIIYTFKGIPFAVPPVGELRFKDPVPIGPWEGVKVGQTPPKCPQVDFMVQNETIMIGQEDCLYLNVYSPKDSAGDLPVMVFIHGGGFFLGDADNIGGTPGFLLTKNIILVSVQYRLGTLGFLSMDDSTIPGNFGMKDQQLALRWVQENIREFGGDPSRVTIFGESAGSASVHLHVVSPLSEGLFQSAILQSGCATTVWATRPDLKKTALQVADILGCSKEGETLDSSNLLNCLQEVPLEDVVLTIKKIAKWTDFPLLMVPRVDGYFLPDHPAKLLKDGHYNKVNIMAGITEHEMVTTAHLFKTNETHNQDFIDNFDFAGPMLFGFDYEESAARTAQSLWYQYSKTMNVTEENFDEHEQLFSDSFFNIAHDEAVLLHARDSSDSGKKVFAYEFQFHGKDTLMERLNMSIGDKWVPHGIELQYLFTNLIGMPNSEDPTNKFVTEIMVKLWTDFAITGNPTPDLSLGFKWDPVSVDNYNFLAIKPSPVMKADQRAERREVWKRLPLTVNKILYPELFVVEDPETSQ